MGLLGHHGLAAWGAFSAVVGVMIAVDLAWAHRPGRAARLSDTIVWNLVWTAAGLGFAGLVTWKLGAPRAAEYVAGYVLERALSLDNVFVFVIILRYFAVPPDLQQRALYFGIFGALGLRGALILAGAAAVARFHWLLYLFGAFLVWTALRMLFADDEAPHPERNPVVRLAGRVFPMTPAFRGTRIFVRDAGRIHATPMLVVLLVIATSDLVFALDSIPAIFGVTDDPYIIVTSNVFAVLGLRAMYFLIAAILPRLHYFNYGLAAVLAFIGFRMLADPWVRIPTGLTLAIVCGVLAVAVAASFARRR